MPHPKFFIQLILLLFPKVLQENLFQVGMNPRSVLVRFPCLFFYTIFVLLLLVIVFGTEFFFFFGYKCIGGKT